MLYKFFFIDKSPRILGNPFTMAWPLAAHNKVFMTASSRSLLSDRPIVSRHLRTALLLFVCLSPSFSPPSSPARLWLRSQGQSEVDPPHHHHHHPVYFSSQSLWPDLGNSAPIGLRSRKELRGWWEKGERGDKKTRSVLWGRPRRWPPDSHADSDSSLTHTDIMGPLIWYRCLLFPLSRLWSLQCQQVY